MLDRVFVFLPPRSRYETLKHFSQEVAAAFTAKGIECTLLDSASLQFPELRQRIQAEQPQLTLCFNGILPDAQRGFLCELLGVPHFAWLVDPPYNFLGLRESPYSFIGVVDQSYATLFHELACPRAFFLPHAVSSDLVHAAHAPRHYPVTFLGTALDHEAIAASWQDYPANLRPLLLECSERVHTEEVMSLDAVLQATGHSVQELESADHEGVALLELWHQVELHSRGRDRMDLLRGLEVEELHVFGSPGQQGGRSWSELLSGLPHVHVHEEVDYAGSLEIVRQSRIVLSSVPPFKHGSHERIFSGLALGSAVVSSASSYLEDAFAPERGVVFYRGPNTQAMSEQLQQWLQDEDARVAAVTAGAALVKQSHTWEQRIDELMAGLQACS